MTIAIRLEGWEARPAPARRDRLAAAVAASAALVWGASVVLPLGSNALDAPEEPAAVHAAVQPPTVAGARREIVLGAYSGVSYTHPSEVRIVNPGRTDMTVKDFGWIGQPFKSPIYYGLRVQRWGAGSIFGTMIDFTHDKAIARRGDEASFTGTRNGAAVAPKAKISDVFSHLEFSHGHNILTFNGLVRLLPIAGMLRPYLGVGAGITLPHTEVGLRDENTRTYEYQFAGFAGQALAGVEINLGRTSVFFEYKFTFAPYDVPLSHEPRGWILFTDLWRQFRAWRSGEAPPGGRLTTDLATHHGVAGLLFRAAPVAR